jgi:hypothetical protein
MTGVARFHEWAPRLVAAADQADSRLLEYARQALSGLEHYDLPIGWKHVPNPIFPVPSWVAAFQVKLESPNYFMRDFRIRSSLRKKWVSQLWQALTKVERVASRQGLLELGRAPRCQDRMAIQVIRFVPSVRMFLHDDDNTAFCTKQLSDALKEVGFIKEDRREWLKAAPLLQDVSPIAGIPITLFVLRPAPTAPSLRSGDSNVHDATSALPRGRRQPQHGGAEEGRARPRLPRKAGPRAIDC